MSSDLKVPKLLTLRQLSEATGVPRWRLYDCVKLGTAPPHMRIGRTIRFPESAVAQWISEQTKTHREGL